MRSSNMLYTLLLISVAWISVDAQCIPGLAVYNKSNHAILSPFTCDNQVVNASALFERPVVSYDKAKYNETYLLMLLEELPRNPDLYILHWLVSGISQAVSNILPMDKGIDLTAGYHSPINQTHYQFRLYNMTGKTVWETVSTSERNNFYPSQWLAKNNVTGRPLANTAFELKLLKGSPPIGWNTNPPVYVQPPRGSGVIPSVYPSSQWPNPNQSQYPNEQTQYPNQQPQYPGQQPQYTVQQPQYPRQPQYPSQQPQYPSQQPQFPSQQPQYPSLQPQYPNQQSQYPNQQSQYPSQQPQFPSQQPQYPRQPMTSSPQYHHVKDNYIINGTHFSVNDPFKRGINNILIINSTSYNSHQFISKFKLTPYLIIDNKSYIWRNWTHTPGNGTPYVINGTHYVPYVPPKEIIHHHYHKNSSSSFKPSIPLYFLLILLAYRRFFSF